MLNIKSEIIGYAEFEILGEIMTKQRPRATIIGGHARVYTPKNTTNYENYIKTIYQDKYPNQHFSKKPISVVINCYFKANNEIQKNVEQLEGNKDVDNCLPCVTIKDVDNIAKIVLDSLNGVAFYDDKQITELRVFKHYTLDQEKIVCLIESVEDRYYYKTLEHLKDEKKLKELREKSDALIDKPKLNKADSERLDKYNKQIKELLDKIKEYDYFDK